MQRCRLSETIAAVHVTPKTLLSVALRCVGFLFGALVLIAAVAGKLIWPSHLRAFLQAERLYWRKLIEWVKRPLQDGRDSSLRF